MKNRVLLFICFSLLITKVAWAQTDTSTKPQKDIGDIVYRIFHGKNKPDSLTDNKKFNYSILPAIGYTLQTGFAGVISANIGFYNSKNIDQKISNINTSYTYSQYKQTILPFYANIWLKNNKINITSDFKYMNYPSEIYGLGGRHISIDLNSNTGYTINFQSLKIHQTVMVQLYKDLFAGSGIFYDRFWNVKVTTDNGKRINRLLNKDINNDELAVGIPIKLLFDNRLNQINPENGTYVSLVYRPNFTFLGSSSQWSSLQIDARKYVHFPSGSKNTLAFWGFAWLSSDRKETPYLMLPSTAWDDQYNTGRGYIQSRFRGHNMFYYENEYRFRITHNSLLGGVVFANVQAFSGDLSPDFAKPHIGYGTGLRIKLNKNSGTNLCIDYGFGQNGSHGFFVNLGELF